MGHAAILFVSHNYAEATIESLTTFRSSNRGVNIIQVRVVASTRVLGPSYRCSSTQEPSANEPYSDLTGKAKCHQAVLEFDR